MKKDWRGEGEGEGWEGRDYLGDARVEWICNEKKLFNLMFPWRRDEVYGHAVELIQMEGRDG